MKTDGLFDYRVCEIPGKYGEDINIIFWGDEHKNSPNHALSEWNEDASYLERLCKKSPTWFIKTGDVFEALSTSERHAFSSGGFHDSNKTRWEREYAREIDDYVKQSKFQIGRTLAVFGGNHYFQFWDGTTSDMALASKLNAPYIGVCGYLVVSIKIDNYHSHIIKIFVHHGRSSGRKAGSAFNALEDAASYFVDADIIVMGHDHKAGAMKISSLELSKGAGNNYKVRANDRIIGRAGSYLKSYEAGVRSYSVDAMYRPSSLGFLQVVITPFRNSKGPKGHQDDERGVKLRAII